MSPTGYHLGFRVVGTTAGRRRLVDAAVALAGYASCDPRAEVEAESYLSAFWFGVAFREHLNATGSTRDYSGPCWSPFAWWDIDRPGEPQWALGDTRRLVAFLLARYVALDEGDLLVFHSGAKGYHVGLPITWEAGPSATFHKVIRRFAEGLATGAGVSIDAGIYDRVRCLRAPNSRHPRTGLHKRLLTHKELMGLTAAGIHWLSREPRPFDLPSPNVSCARGAEDWCRAVEQEKKHAEGCARGAASRGGASGRLNRATLEFIAEGAAEGERATRLFSAAANLTEFGCPRSLAHALLTEAALDCGLPPREVARQIDCGLAHAHATEDNPDG